ncbi:DEBR0S3_07008g1_1 [Brettanomyces bruxellensis]|uniref:Sphingoid long-chain base transporter RSB1 n=1 Tax=Dekkera bruxellensis TaxID=5007 RepID=A0A7D9CXK9_DEKBR|nr:DEBR0S3_07008g1_1 [Brettanomyces bruxellensis]
MAGYNYYIDYAPRYAGNVAIGAIYFVLLVANITLGFLARDKFFPLSFVIGCILEYMGFVGRCMGHFIPTEISWFMVQSIGITIAPIFFMAGIYNSFGEMIVIFGESHSVLKPNTYKKVFIVSDVISLILPECRRRHCCLFGQCWKCFPGRKLPHACCLGLPSVLHDHLHLPHFVVFLPCVPNSPIRQMPSFRVRTHAAKQDVQDVRGGNVCLNAVHLHQMHLQGCRNEPRCRWPVDPERDLVPCLRCFHGYCWCFHADNFLSGCSFGQGCIQRHRLPQC